MVFDLDNTLYEYQPCHKRALKSVSEFAKLEYGLPSRRFREEYMSARMRVKSRVSGASSHNRLLYFMELVNKLQIKLNIDAPLVFNEIYWSSYFLEMTLPEGLEQLLRKLRHLNVQMAIVTDHVSDLQLRKLRVLNLEKQFDYVITSEECSGEKISLEPFDLLFERIERKDFDCIWFIGDELQDWPNVHQVNEKRYFASPFANIVPKGVEKISNYLDLDNLVYESEIPNRRR